MLLLIGPKWVQGRPPRRHARDDDKVSSRVRNHEARVEESNFQLVRGVLQENKIWALAVCFATNVNAVVNAVASVRLRTPPMPERIPPPRMETKRGFDRVYQGFRGSGNVLPIIGASSSLPFSTRHRPTSSNNRIQSPPAHETPCPTDSGTTRFQDKTVSCET